MKAFIESDVRPHGCIANVGSLNVDREDLIYDPLPWQKRGLQQTASGYGRKVTMPEKINFCGRLYRLYCTCFSNAGSVWFTVKGRKIFVH